MVIEARNGLCFRNNEYQRLASQPKVLSKDRLTTEIATCLPVQQIPCSPIRINPSGNPSIRLHSVRKPEIQPLAALILGRGQVVVALLLRLAIPDLVAL